MTETLSPLARSEAPDVFLSSLVEAARAGDTAAFEQLMIATQHKVAATSWRLLGNREDARDATQETFLRAYKYLKSYRPGHDFHGWLYRITVNVCRDMLRGRSGLKDGAHAYGIERTCTEQTLPARAGDTAAEDAALLAQRRVIVRRALETLPEKERTAVVLRDLEGLSTDEVAALMKTRPATVRSQVSTARAKLKIYCERFMRERRM
ncbi:MAG: RNA polymerase sigma factor [Pyrinomonadaceae bacterium]